MSRLRTYSKDIACLESLWDGNVQQDRLTVRPILDLLSTLREIQYTHLTCNTKEEFAFNLKRIPKKKSYSILYLSFHGSPGKLYLADGSEINLNDLAAKMGSRFRDWVIHFGSCGTLAAFDEKSDFEPNDFKEKTGASLLIGYKSYVDWAESAALDLLILNQLQEYKDTKSFTNKIKASYPGLVEKTGLDFYPR